MSLFTHTFAPRWVKLRYVYMHSNSSKHIKISSKRQIFICHVTIEAQSTAYANLNS